MSLGAGRESGQDRRKPNGESTVSHETIFYQEKGPVGTLTLNRPDDGTMFAAAKFGR